MPSLLGTKINCYWSNPGDLLRVLSSEARQVCRCETERFCRFTDGGLQFWIGASGFRMIDHMRSTFVESRSRNSTGNSTRPKLHLVSTFSALSVSANFF